MKLLNHIKNGLHTWLDEGNNSLTPFNLRTFLECQNFGLWMNKRFLPIKLFNTTEGVDFISYKIEIKSFLRPKNV